MDSAKAFRTAALVEAITWIALLIAMAFKYGPAHDPIGVKIAGPIHGVAFLCYVTATVLASREYAWSKRVTLIGLAASIPPVFTALFERWVSRRGGLVADAADLGTVGALP
jgi:integral membrane protein